MKKKKKIENKDVKTKTLRQSVTFKDVSPSEVYNTYLDSKKHKAFTQSKASISKVVGGKFSAWNKNLEGENLELVKDKRIVQSWRASHWPKKYVTRVTFKFKKVKGGTKLTFTQSGLPSQYYNDIKQGWIEHYWDRMKAYFLRD